MLTTSSERIVGSHVLHSLLVSRHPPSTLLCLDTDVDQHHHKTFTYYESSAFLLFVARFIKMLFPFVCVYYLLICQTTVVTTTVESPIVPVRAFDQGDSTMTITIIMLLKRTTKKPRRAAEIPKTTRC